MRTQAEIANGVCIEQCSHSGTMSNGGKQLANQRATTEHVFAISAMAHQSIGIARSGTHGPQ